MCGATEHLAYLCLPQRMVYILFEITAQAV